ncbi:MAG: hypothetical protein MJY62_05380 [Bacteroidales bacterium]|nr:hypothetical protein [Bacteroidales bacterium]
MKKFLNLFIALPAAILIPGMLLPSCAKDAGVEVPEPEIVLPEGVTDLGNGEGLEHGMMVLGEQLENPYSLENMQQAYSNMYPTKAPALLEATHLYVRVKPESSSDIDDLRARGASVTDFPLDYEVVRDGDYYHDPEVPEDEITWQYVVVPRNFDFGDLKFEVIDDCFIAGDEEYTKAADIDWDAVEEEAYRITGNGDKLLAATKGGGTNPRGRITITDEDFNRGKPFGLAEVKVQCNVFVKFSSTYTDRDGYYTIPAQFKANPHYRIIYENRKGFAIGVNLILVRGSVATLGKQSPCGVSICINKYSDTKMWKRSVVNNAAYEYYVKCSSGTDIALGNPPADIRFWLFDGLSCSSATMLHHGAVSGLELLDNWIGQVGILIVRFLMPDITIGTNGNDSYASLFSVTCHEMAHASHYGKVGNDYWDEYIKYIIRCFLHNPKDTYGDGSLAGAGYCDVGESWAYYMESKMYQARYGGAAPTFGTDSWFRPQIFHYLTERGMSPANIFSALIASVTDRPALRAQLVALFPSKTKYIDQAFAKYDER